MRSKPPTDDVDAFLAALDHPLKPEILELRRIILGAHPAIVEGIKWNAPSFRTSEDFATFQLRAKDGVQIILHSGAKKRDRPVSRDSISDPESLLRWLAADRASVTFRDMREVLAREAAFAGVLREWVERLSA
jgi:hypothetical protein